IAAENNSTTIFPVPIELFRPFLDMAAGRQGASASPALPAPAALPPAEVPMPARELSELMSRLRSESLEPAPRPRDD
ncbi:MAG: hypothetical protein MUC69_01090, partial [Gemmatimonadales bacterium]|nr:hypothetical protein [Gemmatimonadales bacterium]